MITYIWTARWSSLFAILFASLQAVGASSLTCDGLFARPTEIKKMDKLRVAAVQFPLGEKGTPESFLVKVDGYVREAKAGGADLVVFPELITTELVDWQSPQGDHSQLERIARDFTPRFSDWLARRAREENIAILGGTTPRMDGDKIVNTALLALPDGRVHQQDKIFLTPDEKDWNWSPGSTLKVIDAPWGKTVIAICFDCEFPVIANMLSKFKPELMLIPSWTSTLNGLNRVDWSARGHAVGQYSFVVKTGTVAAQDATQPHFGQASVITPQEPGWPTAPIDGKLNEAAIVYGDLDMAKLREKKAQSGYYPGHEQGTRRAPLRIETVE